MGVEPPAKKQRVGEAGQTKSPLEGQPAKGHTLVQAVKDLLKPETQRKQAGEGACDQAGTVNWAKSLADMALLLVRQCG